MINRLPIHKKTFIAGLIRNLLGLTVVLDEAYLYGCLRGIAHHAHHDTGGVAESGAQNDTGVVQCFLTLIIPSIPHYKTLNPYI